MNNLSSKSEYEKTHFNVNIAGVEAEINTVYPSSYYFCDHYLSDGTPVLTIEITQEDIEREIEKGRQHYFTYTGYTDKGETKDKVYEGRAETSVLFRKFIEAVLAYDIIFMHGAVISVQNQAYMFTAPSGTGKTTHIMHWLQNIRDAFVINGDKPLVRIKDDSVTAYGTPWCGKEKMETNTEAPLKAIVLMERSEENHIEEISFGQAYTFLLQQTYLPHDPEKAKKTLALLAKLGKQVRIYIFKFNNYADDCFDVAYHGILGTME